METRDSFVEAEVGGFSLNSSLEGVNPTSAEQFSHQVSEEAEKSPCSQSSEKIENSAIFGSKEWANDQLRFAIRILQGEGVVATWKGRLQIVLYVKNRLEDMAFWWQAERIENWIHRLQPREADSQKDGKESLHCP